MENKKPEKKRSEHLSTTIGDMLRKQGNDILKTEKKPYKNNNKKYNKQKPYKKNYNKKPPVDNKAKNDEIIKKALDEAVKKGILKADDNTSFDMRTPEQIEADKYKDGVVIKDGTMEEFADAFLAEAEKEGPVMEEDTSKVKFTISSEYITKEGSDTRVRTDTFITK